MHIYNIYKLSYKIKLNPCIKNFFFSLDKYSISRYLKPRQLLRRV